MASIPHHQQWSKIRNHTDKTQDWEGLRSQEHTPQKWLQVGNRVNKGKVRRERRQNEKIPQANEPTGLRIRPKGPHTSPLKPELRSKRGSKASIVWGRKRFARFESGSAKTSKYWRTPHFHDPKPEWLDESNPLFPLRWTPSSRHRRS